MTSSISEPIWSTCSQGISYYPEPPKIFAILVYLNSTLLAGDRCSFSTELGISTIEQFLFKTKHVQDPTPPAEPTQTRLNFEFKGAGWYICTCVGPVESCSPYVHAHDYGAYNLGRKKSERDEFESKGKV